MGKMLVIPLHSIKNETKAKSKQIVAKNAYYKFS